MTKLGMYLRILPFALGLATLTFVSPFNGLLIVTAAGVISIMLCLPKSN